MKKLTVCLTRSPRDRLTVGTLAEQDNRIFFEYASEFLATGLELSPFKLPLRSGLIEHTERGFGTLPGLFDDSLPDGWGLLLMDRRFLGQGLEPSAVSPLDRLAYLGTRTMGALTYHPPLETPGPAGELDLFALGRNAERVLAGEAEEVLPQMMRAGGSPAGARPKVLVGIKGGRIMSGVDDLPAGYEPWIVKFAARPDAPYAGPIEYAYALMATAAGIEMPQVRLLQVSHGRSSRRFFAVRRFDRIRDNGRVHMASFANLIHTNFRIPSTDYADLLKVTRALTRNHQDVLQAFRRMVFNVAAHNRDDHAKNFSFKMDDGGEWSLSPAYDLTLSTGPGGEHSMTVLGEGRRPARGHCLGLAEQFGLKPRELATIMEEVNAAIRRWPELADQAGCTRQLKARVAAHLTLL